MSHPGRTKVTRDTKRVSRVTEISPRDLKDKKTTNSVLAAKLGLIPKPSYKEETESSRDKGSSSFPQRMVIDMHDN